MKEKKKFSLKSVDDMISLIHDLIQTELSKQTQIVLCQVAQKKEDHMYDIYVVPDFNHIIHDIKNELSYELKEGDYVYVLKINNQFANSFIVHKL